MTLRSDNVKLRNIKTKENSMANCTGKLPTHLTVEEKAIILDMYYEGLWEFKNGQFNLNCKYDMELTHTVNLDGISFRFWHTPTGTGVNREISYDVIAALKENSFLAALLGAARELEGKLNA